MSLSKQYSEIFEPHREILVIRKKMIENRIKLFALWEMKARRAGAEEVADIVAQSVASFFDQEILAIEFLLKALDETQKAASGVIASWEAEAAGGKNEFFNGVL